MRWRWRWAAVIVAMAVVLVGLGAIAGGWVLLPYDSPGSNRVGLTVVSRSGPPATGDVILAAPSMNDLTSLVLAVDRFPDSCPGGSCWPGAKAPGSALLIALPTPAPCRRSALNADLSAGGVLEIHVVVGPWECAAGSNALAAPNFWLLAIPRGALPSKALSVVIDDRPPLINLRSGYLSTWTTTVDLRGPSENSGGAIGVAELQTNIDDARRDAYARGLQANRILEFGLFRWPSGAAMCSAPTDSPAGEVWGSFLVVADYHSAMEFRAAAGATVFCRSRSL